LSEEFADASEPSDRQNETHVENESLFLPEARKLHEKRVGVLKNDPEFCKAVEVLKKFHTRLIPSDLFEDMLPYLASIAIPRKSCDPKKVLETISAAATGKTWKALKGSPARFRRIAKEIEQINQSPVMSPANWVKDSEVMGRLLKGYFLRLPGVLNLYALWLEMLIADKLPKLWNEQVPASRRGLPDALFFLSGLVKALTGRFHDREVCNLLDAAARALGVDHQFDPILQWRKNFLKLIQEHDRCSNRLRGLLVPSIHMCTCHHAARNSRSH
jgi:hypothetical protein